MVRKRKEPKPEKKFVVAAGADGFPEVKRPEDNFVGATGGAFETSCVFCYSRNARIGIDKRGKPYVVCSSCSGRTFFYTPEGSRVLRAQHRLLQDDGAREYAMRMLATQMD